MSNQLEILPSQLHFKPFKLDELEVRSYAMIPSVREALVNVHGTNEGEGEPWEEERRVEMLIIIVESRGYYF